MLCVAKPPKTVGPTARRIALPSSQSTDCTCACRGVPADDDDVEIAGGLGLAYVTATDVGEVCGTAESACTNAIAAAAGVVALAVAEYGPRLLAASVARTR